MNCTSSTIYHDGFNVGDIVWAKRDYDGIYWPGKINYISNNVNDTNYLQYQTWSYLIQFFEYDQTHWTVDILPYRQYRDYMSKNLLIHYESYPQMKYQFLNAINQADFNSNSNYDSQSSNMYHQYMTNYPMNNYYPTYSTRNQLSIETNLNSIPQLNNDYQQLSNVNTDFQKQTSVIIITNKSYSNSSFISYIFNSFSHFFHHSVIYIDDLNIINYQHPNTSSNIYYLICLDHFDSTIQQTLNSTILTNFNAHFNYYFLILNSPNNDLIKHFYSTMMDKRTILVLHYHSTFENEPLLLCSGNRQTYEMIRLTILRYLCSKIKYIESQENEALYPINDIKNEPNEKFESPIIKHSKKLNRRKVFKRKLKQRLSKTRMLSITSSEYYVQNILNDYNSSK